MKNKTGDLHNILFEELERLSDPDITGDELASEIERSRAMIGISSQLISNAKLALDVAEYKANYINPANTLPDFLDE